MPAAAPCTHWLAGLAGREGGGPYRRRSKAARGCGLVWGQEPVAAGAVFAAVWPEVGSVEARLFGSETIALAWRAVANGCVFCGVRRPEFHAFPRGRAEKATSPIPVECESRWMMMGCFFSCSSCQSCWPVEDAVPLMIRAGLLI